MSLNPGIQQYGETKTGIHVTKPDGTVKAEQPVTSITQDPMTPVEYGRTAADSKYNVTASNGAEIPNQGPGSGGGAATGPVTGVSLVGTTSTAGDGARTGVATTSNGSGTNATVSYTVAGGFASNASVVNGGSGYAAGEQITVADDTGVIMSVTI